MDGIKEKVEGCKGCNQEECSFGCDSAHLSEEELMKEKIIEIMRDSLIVQKIKEDNYSFRLYFETVTDRILSLSEKKCVWTKIDPEEEEYETSCGEAFFTLNGTVKENNFKHCPYCGGVIQIEEEGK